MVILESKMQKIQSFIRFDEGRRWRSYYQGCSSRIQPNFSEFGVLVAGILARIQILNHAFRSVCCETPAVPRLADDAAHCTPSSADRPSATARMAAIIWSASWSAVTSTPPARKCLAVTLRMSATIPVNGSPPGPVAWALSRVGSRAGQDLSMSAPFETCGTLLCF